MRADRWRPAATVQRHRDWPVASGGHGNRGGDSSEQTEERPNLDGRHLPIVADPGTHSEAAQLREGVTVGDVLAGAFDILMIAGSILGIVAADRVSTASVKNWGDRRRPPWPFRLAVGPRSPREVRTMGIFGVVFFGALLALTIARG